MPPQQDRARETRTRIMDAGEACFAGQGYDATGLAEICRRADVSRGAFYHHFTSKQALFLALLNRWLARLDAGFEAVQAGTADVPTAIAQMAGIVSEILCQRRGQLPILFEFWVQAARDPVIWEAATAPYRRYREYFCRLIECGVAQGTLDVADPELAAQMLVSLAIGLLLQGLLDGDDTDWGEVTQRGVGLLLQSLSAAQKG